MNETPEPSAAPVAVEKARRAPKLRAHWLEQEPPPPIRAYTVEQIETEHPGIKGKLRSWIAKADAGDPFYAWLRFCIIRVGRNVLIDDVLFRQGLYEHTATPPAPARRTTTEAA